MGGIIPGSLDPSLNNGILGHLEGTENVFAAFGYNRDRKSGTRQIVIGLPCDAVRGDGKVNHGAAA